MITVEIRDPSKAAEGLSVVEIYCDIEGARDLISQLNIILEGETHVHLMTPEWAGSELSSTQQSEKSFVVNHLLIQRVPD